MLDIVNGEYTFPKIWWSLKLFRSNTLSLRAINNDKQKPQQNLLDSVSLFRRK